MCIRVYRINGCLLGVDESAEDSSESQDEDGLSLTSTMIQTSGSSRRRCGNLLGQCLTFCFSMNRVFFDGTYCNSND